MTTPARRELIPAPSHRTTTMNDSHKPNPPAKRPSDDDLDLLVIAIQALRPEPSPGSHDLATVDRGREILREWLARFGHQPAPPAEEALPSDGGYKAGTMWTGHPLRLFSAAQPAPPDEGEGEPSREDLLRIAEQAAHIEQDGIFDALEEGYPLELTALDILEICRAVYRLGRPANPPAEGEVAELVEWLRSLEDASVWFETDSLEALKLTRIAELLEQRHPAPVPVSERPWERDGWCDESGKCWWGRHESDDNYADWTFCTYEDTQEFCTYNPMTVCIPAHALPLPAGEVEK